MTLPVKFRITVTRRQCRPRLLTTTSYELLSVIVISDRPHAANIVKMASANPASFFAATTNSFVIPDANTDVHKLIGRW